MNVGFIGAGKVGCSFGKYFQEHKIQVTGFYSKSEDSSLAASNFTSSKQYLNLRELVDENDTIFITTPDGQIQEVWQEIKNYQIKNKLICHAVVQYLQISFQIYRTMVLMAILSILCFQYQINIIHTKN